MCFPGFSSNYYSSQKKLAKGQTLLLIYPDSQLHRKGFKTLTPGANIIKNYGRNLRKISSK